MIKTHFHTLAVTPGEPAGIGPDIVLQVIAEGVQQQLNCQLIVFADLQLLNDRAKMLDISLPTISYQDWCQKKSFLPDYLIVESVPLSARSSPGKLDAANAKYVINTLSAATEMCLQKKLDALVTGPVHKSIINQAGISFSGHTELLKELTHSPQTVMLFVSDPMKVALFTTHIPLRDVANNINATKLKATIKLIHGELIHKFRMRNPRIVVCGVNPHAGEEGHIGDEEQKIIIPTLQELKVEGYAVFGPVAADTIFLEESFKNFDVILAMYHDQALPVVKYRGFGNAVNVTLGLPFVRTSVDHGTALQFAGTGEAKSSSLIAALQLARQLLKVES